MVHRIKRKEAWRIVPEAAEASGFVQLGPRSGETDGGAARVELLLRSGHRVRLSGPIDIESVTRLVAALEPC